MIRNFGPILLIPAAWTLTAVTIPGFLTEYWVRHMHYFIFIFLVGFLAMSTQMLEDDVLRYWYAIIAGGVLAIFAGILSFHDVLPSWGLAVSLIYWVFSPAKGMYLSALEMERFESTYKVLAGINVSGMVILFAGIYLTSLIALSFGLFLIAASQTVSLILASEMDGNVDLGRIRGVFS